MYKWTYAVQTPVDQGSTVLHNFNLHKVFKVVKLLEAKSKMVVARGWGKGEEGSCSMSVEFLFSKMKMF